MTDRAAEIMACLAKVCETLDLPLELDRRYPVLADSAGPGVPDDMPLVVLRTGDEEMETEGMTPASFGFRWTMRPFVEVYLQDREDPDALVPQANQLWATFLSELPRSGLLRLLTHKTVPGLTRDLQPVPGRPDVMLMVIGLTLRFERRARSAA